MKKLKHFWSGGAFIVYEGERRKAMAYGILSLIFLVPTYFDAVKYMWTLLGASLLFTTLMYLTVTRHPQYKDTEND